MKCFVRHPCSYNLQINEHFILCINGKSGFNKYKICYGFLLKYLAKMYRSQIKSWVSGKTTWRKTLTSSLFHTYLSKKLFGKNIKRRCMYGLSPRCTFLILTLLGRKTLLYRTYRSIALFYQVKGGHNLSVWFFFPYYSIHREIRNFKRLMCYISAY